MREVPTILHRYPRLCRALASCQRIQPAQAARLLAVGYYDPGFLRAASRLGGRRLGRLWRPRWECPACRSILPPDVLRCGCRTGKAA